MAKTSFYLRWNKNDLPAWTRDPERAFPFDRESAQDVKQAALGLLRAFPGESDQEYRLETVKVYKPGMKGYGWGIVAIPRPAQSVDDEDSPWADLNPEAVDDWKGSIHEALLAFEAEHSPNTMKTWQLAVAATTRLTRRGVSLDYAGGITPMTYFEAATVSLAKDGKIEVDDEAGTANTRPRKRKQ